MPRRSPPLLLRAGIHAWPERARQPALLKAAQVALRSCGCGARAALVEGPLLDALGGYQPGLAGEELEVLAGGRLAHTQLVSNETRCRRHHALRRLHPPAVESERAGLLQPLQDLAASSRRWPSTQCRLFNHVELSQFPIIIITTRCHSKLCAVNLARDVHAQARTHEYLFSHRAGPIADMYALIRPHVRRTPVIDVNPTDFGLEAGADRLQARAPAARRFLQVARCIRQSAFPPDPARRCRGGLPGATMGSR